MEQLNIKRANTSYGEITISDFLESKIRFLCSRIHNIEWSGILLYEVQENTKDEKISLTCHDLILMDIGNETYTEFEFNNEIAVFFAENPDKLHYKTGLIHSHHGMKTFFSGTDINTLREFGNIYDNFLSLIVNNSGEYTAAITKRITEKVIGRKYISYLQFGKNESNTEYEVENTYIEYSILDIKYSDYMSSISNKIKELMPHPSRSFTSLKVKEDIKTEDVLDYNNYYKNNSYIKPQSKSEEYSWKEKEEHDYELEDEEDFIGNYIYEYYGKDLEEKALQILGRGKIYKSITDAINAFTKKYKGKEEDDDAIKEINKIIEENLYTENLESLLEIQELFSDIYNSYPEIQLVYYSVNRYIDSYRNRKTNNLFHRHYYDY